MRRLAAIGFVMLAACGGGNANDSAPVHVSTPSPSAGARERIRSIENYVVYYGLGRLDDLARFDLAIIDRDTLTPGEVHVLQSRGTLVVAYLSVGEIQPNDPRVTSGEVPQSWILGTNENWGSLFVDASQPGWRELMKEEAGSLLEAGFDGVFLDTVDTAIDVAPDTMPGMIELIEGLRAAYPDALLVQNRGFDIAERVATSIDAVMFEDLSTSYDFDTAEYTRVDNSSEAQEMVALRDATGLPILALDYADPSDPQTAARATRIARSYGFIPAVSVIQLDDIPDYGAA
jgi:polysaccharide biosynthesis protein PelA